MGCDIHLTVEQRITDKWSRVIEPTHITRDEAIDAAGKEPPPRKPVCKACNDTHQMPAWDSRGAIWMCNRCPGPCQRCHAGGNGPFCETTPCACEYHAGKESAR